MPAHRPIPPSGWSSSGACSSSTAARATSPGRSRCSRTASRSSGGRPWPTHTKLVRYARVALASLHRGRRSVPGPPTCSAPRSPTAATRSTSAAARGASTSSRGGLAAAGEVEQALRFADRSLSLYELDEDNRALSEAHLAYAQRLLDVGDAEAGRHLHRRPQPARRASERDRPRAHPGRGRPPGAAPSEMRRRPRGERDQAVRALGEVPTEPTSAMRTSCSPGSRTSWASWSGPTRPIPQPSRPSGQQDSAPRATSRGHTAVRQVPEAARPGRGGPRGVRARRRPGAVEPGCAGAATEARSGTTAPTRLSGWLLGRPRPELADPLDHVDRAGRARRRRARPDRARAPRRGRGGAPAALRGAEAARDDRDGGSRAQEGLG